MIVIIFTLSNFTLFRFMVDSKLSCGGSASVRSVVVTGNWLLFPVAFSITTLLVPNSTSLLSLPPCLIGGGAAGNGACGCGCGCGFRRGGDSLLTLGNEVALCSSCLFRVSTFNGHWEPCFFVPGLQMRTGEKRSSECRPESNAALSTSNCIWT